MNDLTDLKEGSVVEYSLAELGFVLVFVLLLLSGWEINSNAQRLKEEAKSLAELQRQLNNERKKNEALVAAIAVMPPEEQELTEDFMFVRKEEFIALQARASDADIIEQTLTELEEDNLRMSDQLASITEGIDSSEPVGGKVGTVGFCTYDQPDDDSVRVYGKSVALGTLLVEEDGITLLEKNSAIQHRSFVDIAGEEYDTGLAAEALENWPLNKKLSPSQFNNIGSRFMEIGELPSYKRVACRFGMDYFISVYSKKSATMLDKVLEGSFFKNLKLEEAEFAARFPNYATVLLPLTEMPPNDDSKRSIDTSERAHNGGLPWEQGRLNSARSAAQSASVAETPTRILSQVTPIFPERAERRGISGLVEIAYKVSIYGQAIDIELIREQPRSQGFGKASIAALEQYIFKPATKNGEPVESRLRELRFRF